MAKRRVLTVGDGDLSYSLALARCFGPQIELTATTLLATEADSRPDMGIGQILSMPTQAQRELSASVKALQTADFEADAKQ